MTSLQSQYLLCPLLACKTVRTSLGIDSINWRIPSCWILPHFCQEPTAVLADCGAGWLLYTRRSKSSHKCSIVFKFGDIDGQGSTVTLWLARESTVAQAVCGRVFSCWTTSLLRFIAGSRCGVKTSSLYRAALRFQGMYTSWLYRA